MHKAYAFVQVLHFYASQGLRLPQQPPLLMVKSAELGNAASKEHHHSSARDTPGSTGAAPVFHTRWPLSPYSSILYCEVACKLNPSSLVLKDVFSITPASARLASAQPYLGPSASAPVLRCV